MKPVTLVAEPFDHTGLNDREAQVGRQASSDGLLLTKDYTRGFYILSIITASRLGGNMFADVMTSNDLNEVRSFITKKE